METMPIVGGIGIFAGVLVALAVAVARGGFEPSGELVGIVGGCAIVFLAGLWDDIRSLGPLGKLGAQIVASALVIGTGTTVTIVGHGVIGAGIALLWLVGLTNAFNLLDNMDGLAATLAALAAGFFAIDAYFKHSNVEVLALSVAVALACTGFLPFNLRPGRRAAFTEAVEKEMAAIREEYRPVEPDLRFEIAEGSASESVWSEDLGRRVLLLLNVLPHGVLAMSHDIEGLVETSVNLAAVAEGGDGVGVLLSTRSSIGSALRALRRRLRACGELVGAQLEENEGYPAWKPNLESPLLRQFQEVHRRVQGSEPELKALHAGLECGVLGEKFPGMDTISFGPIIEGAHSPDERVKVDSVGRFYKLLTETLAELARG